MNNPQPLKRAARVHQKGIMSGTVVLEATRKLRAVQRWRGVPPVYRRFAVRVGLLALAVFATAQFVGAYLFLEFPYVDLYRFERGYERLPFQTRLLLAPVYRWADSCPSLIAYAGQLSRNTYFFPRGIVASEVLEFFLDIACVLFAGWVSTRIYRAASRRHLLQPLVFPIFLGLCILAYILHTVQNFRYVYDMPSLAFFAGGFYLIYFRKPALWFITLFAIATLNRETVLLLLPFYAFSAAVEQGRFEWRALFAPRVMQVVLPLALYWAVWHHVVFGIFAHNASEYYPRVPFNLRCFARLRYYPQLLSCFGFLGPFLFAGRRFVADQQLRIWLWALPLWYGFMFTWAILVETRVFGELIPFLAVYTAVMGEEWLARRMLTSSSLANSLEKPSRISQGGVGRRAA